MEAGGPTLSREAYPQQGSDFVAAATRALRFLEDEGYRLSEVAEHRVEYVSPRASVRLGLSATPDDVYRTLELSLRRNTSEQWYTADQIGFQRWHVGDVKAHDALRAAPPTGTPDELRASVERLARTLREQLAREVAGDTEAWDAIELGASQERRSGELANALDRGASEARTAFADGDYARVVDVLGPLEPHLGPPERKRLEIARRRAG